MGGWTPVCASATKILSSLLSLGGGGDATKKAGSALHAEPTFSVVVSNRPGQEVVPWDAGRNDPAGPYHVRDPAVRKTRMTGREWVRSCAGWTEAAVALEVPLAGLFRRGQGGAVGNGDDATSDDIVGNIAPVAPADVDAPTPVAAWAQACLPPRSRAAGALLARNGGLLDWAALGALAASQGWRPVAARLRGLSTGAHHAPQLVDVDRLICPCRGRLRIIAFPPQAVLPCGEPADALLRGSDDHPPALFPFPRGHPHGGGLQVSLRTPPDARLWPGAASVRGWRAVLSPSDTLVVPASWCVAVEALGDGNDRDVKARGPCAWTEIDLEGGPGLASHASAAVALAWRAERAAAELEGHQGAREFLVRVAAGGRQARFDVSSVRGYRRTALGQAGGRRVRVAAGFARPHFASTASDTTLGNRCQAGPNNPPSPPHPQAIRDDVAATLGPGHGHVRRLLSAVCDRRLLPTNWLNAGWRPPLMLGENAATLAAPRRIEDDRTDEERQHPQLFRAQLEARGWKVPASETWLPRP